MHRFLRAIGFSNQSRKEIQKIIFDSIRGAEQRNYTLDSDDMMVGEFSRDYADGLGITASGYFDEDDKFHMDYYFPHIEGKGVTTCEDVSVERHASGESFAGVCDDFKVGISIIFYLQNKIPYVKAQTMGKLPIRGTTLTLAGLSVSGRVILPVQKYPEDREKYATDSAKRAKLLAAAKSGDEEAIETLTLEDMDIYTTISKRIYQSDIYTLVDTSFMPYGVECDQYCVLGEIVDCRKVTNHITEEEIYILSLFCNDLTFDVAINIMDLDGEPEIGRRFKGVVWLQGKINFPEETF